MFKQKNALISLAVVMLVAACGGGGGSDNNNPPVTPPVDNPGTPIPTVDAKLDGTLLLASDQVWVGGIAQPYEAFISTTARVDDPATVGFDESGYGIYGRPKGVNAPLLDLGYRVEFDPTVPAIALEAKRGRLAFELQDQAGAASQEILRIEIDQVDIAVSATNELTLAIPATAMLHVYAKTEAGQESIISTAATPDLITQSDIDGDDGLILNIDAAVAAAKTAATGTDLAVMTNVATFSSGKDLPFEVALTLSNVKMALSSAPATELVGKTIAVGTSRPGVTGGGIAKGYVRVDPEAVTP